MRRSLAVLLLVACRAPAPEELRVVSFTPRGAIDAAQPIELRFDRPAVDADQVSRAADPGSVAIVPPIAWRGYWQDRETLVVEPTEPLARSTRYQVTLAGELGARSHRFAFAFVHAPLAVDGVWGIAADAIPTDGDLPVSFNQPVAPDQAAAHCKLAGERGTDIALVAHAGAPAAELALRPAVPLAPGAAYTLTCVGLAGAGGNAVLDAPYTLAVRARRQLAVRALAPAGNAIVPDAVSLTVTFTTPVTLDAARKAVSSVPPIARLDRGELSGDGMTYQVTADLEADTDYAIAVAGLSDVYGQALAQPYRAAFHTGPARPRLAMARGLVALDAGYPVWARAVSGLDVRCAPLTRDRAVQLIASDEVMTDWTALRARTAHLPLAARDAWQRSDLDLGATCSGAPGARGPYLAELGAPELAERTRVIADVTDLDVVVVPGATAGVAWVTSRATGAPVDGARVTLYTAQGKPLHADLTNRDGLVKLPGTTGPVIATAEHAGELAIARADGAAPAGSGALRGSLDADRALYHPGDAVHVRGLARGLAADGPRVPARGDVAIEVRDSRGQAVLVTRAPLSAFGGFAFELDLPGDAALGDYAIAAGIAGDTLRGGFTVEEARPATFAVALAAPGAVRVGDRLAFALDARYAYGAPVAGAHVEWNVRRRGDDELVADGSGETTAAGHLAIAARDSASAQGPVDYVLTATVTEASGESQTARAQVTARASSLQLAVRAAERIEPAGVPFAIELAAVAPDGAPTAAAAHLTLIRRERTCSWRELGRERLRRCDGATRTMLERDVAIATAGTIESIAPTEPGDYVLRAETSGHVAAETELWVTGAGDPLWGSDDDRVTVVASRPSYAPGDTARLVAETDLAASALVTIERDGVLDARVVPAGQPIELAIADAWAPGVTARVTLVSPERIASGTVELAVAPRPLDVALALDRDRVEPGQLVTGTIRVTDRGAPVRAEVALAASPAYWAPALVTDDRGEVAFRFVAPDRAAALQLVATAADAGDRFGTSARRVVVDKQLAAQPIVPRFLVAGDSTSIGVEIENHTARPGTAIVTAASSGAELAGDTRAVALPAGGRARVRFAVTAGDAARARFEFTVLMDGRRDRVEVTVPIGKPSAGEPRGVETALGAGHYGLVP